MKHFRDYREIARHVVALCAAQVVGRDKCDFNLGQAFAVAEAIEDEACRRQQAFLEAEALKYKSAPAPRPL